MTPNTALNLTIAIYLLTAFVWVRNDGNWSWGYRSILGGAALLLAAADRYFQFSQTTIDFIRKLAQEQGWYEARRWLQTIAALLIVSLLAALCLLQTRPKSHSKSSLRVLTPTICLLSLLVFCCLRALSNHFIDAWLSVTFVGLRVNWIIEWLMLGLVIICSLGPSPHASSHIHSA